ncbi:hypothetical protein DFJ74DRAFT_708508 [Hyaloraphidium curvatum]|nr:hypothetical protein DFJ74DRAFT_708508 [Hyaloraphidium curvatum]
MVGQANGTMDPASKGAVRPPGSATPASSGAPDVGSPAGRAGAQTDGAGVKRLVDFGVIEREVVELIVGRDDRLSEKVAKSLKVLEEAYERYGPDGFALSFNGGKDCTVLLHLQAAALYLYERKRHPDYLGVGLAGAPIKTVYVTVPHSFPDVDEFVDECQARYGLDLIRLPSPMKSALQSYLDHDAGVKAVCVGTRRTDPYGSGLKPFLPTDNGWPDLMRVHAIVDWDYSDVWDFLLSLKVSYCKLYDQGYTSLGGTNNTEPNPALRRPDGTYEPAYKLKDGGLEREGRL